MAKRTKPRKPGTVASRVLDALRRTGRSCTRGELGAMFVVGGTAAEIQAALDELLERGVIERVWVEDRRAWHGAWATDSTMGRWQRWEYRLAAVETAPPIGR